jgi:hypothetical protein
MQFNNSNHARLTQDQTASIKVMAPNNSKIQSNKYKLQEYVLMCKVNGEIDSRATSYAKMCQIKCKLIIYTL